jgi:TonB family protein
MAASGQARGFNGVSRRRIPRYGVHLPLDVIVLRSGIPDKVPGRSVDLSESGVAVILAAELVKGEVVGVELLLPEQAELLRWRAVVRYQDRLRCGMEFSGLSAEQKAAIRKCTKELMAMPEPKRMPIAGSFRPLNTLAEALADYTNDDVDGGDGVKSESADVGNSLGGGKSGGRRGKRTFALLICLLITCAILLAVFWVRWNRGWEELESGLPGRQEAAIDTPQAQVAALEMEKLVIHRVDPDYPAEARKAKLQTVIALDVIVGKDGSVLSVRPLNGPEVLARSAVEALRWWKFEPYRINGEPKVVETTLAVEFKP